MSRAGIHFQVRFHFDFPYLELELPRSDTLGRLKERIAECKGVTAGSFVLAYPWNVTRPGRPETHSNDTPLSTIFTSDWYFLYAVPVRRRPGRTAPYTLTEMEEDRKYLELQLSRNHLENELRYCRDDHGCLRTQLDASDEAIRKRDGELTGIRAVLSTWPPGSAAETPAQTAYMRTYPGMIEIRNERITELGRLREDRIRVHDKLAAVAETIDQKQRELDEINLQLRARGD